MASGRRSAAPVIAIPATLWPTRTVGPPEASRHSRTRSTWRSMAASAAGVVSAPRAEIVAFDHVASRFRHRA